VHAPSYSNLHDPRLSLVILAGSLFLVWRLLACVVSLQIVASNAEAKNAVSVLMNNRDSYMLNPCKSDAFLIVELCDDIQVHSFDLANFELYSSMIHGVKISISDM